MDESSSEPQVSCLLDKHSPTIEVGMLVRTRWKPYLPNALGPFAFELTQNELLGLEDLSNITFSKTSFRVIYPTETCLVVKMVGRQAILLLGLKFLCIDKEFLQPWSSDDPDTISSQ